MLRFKGNDQNIRGLTFFNNIMGFYSKSNDPSWLKRHNAGGPTSGPFNGLPVNPAIYAHSIQYTFKSAYDVNTTNVWTQDSSGSGTVLAVQDARGGKARFTNGALDDNYYTYTAKYEVAKLENNKDLWFFTTIAVADVDEADMFIGLCAKLASGNLFDNRVDAMGFYLEDGSAVLKYECRKDGVASYGSTGVSLSDNTVKSIGIHAFGKSAVRFFVGDSVNQMHYVATVITNIPDDEELAVAFGLRNGKASANSMVISTIDVRMDI